MKRAVSPDKQYRQQVRKQARRAAAEEARHEAARREFVERLRERRSVR